MDRIVLALLLGFALAGCEPPPPRQQLDEKQLELQARGVAGLCAQAVMLANLKAVGSVNAAYPWVEQQAMSQELTRRASTLSAPAAAPALRERQRELLRIVAEAQVLVQQIAQSGPDRQPPLRERFEALKMQAGRAGAAAS